MKNEVVATDAVQVKPLEFVSIEQAVRVLKPYKTVDKLRALVGEGWVLSNYRHKQLAAFVGASREKVSQALQKLRKEND